MFIKKVVLKNFKSFGKKTEIPFIDGFVVISGPNGSGKSNIIDSILFCLGLTPSTKQLRADRLTDLIHNGKNEAEVTVVFQSGNKSYEVTRKVKITDKGYYSYYYLNGKSTNLSEIHKFLSQFGIYSDAYNVVMQGDVTRITEMSPLQRRKIIDDIAGISEFDEKKEKALEELDKVRENVEKLDAVISEVNNRLDSLEKDKNEALKYKTLVEEREKYLTFLKAHKLLTLLSNKDRVKREIDRLEGEKDSAAKRLPEIIRQSNDIARKIEVIAEKISKLGDERISEIQSEILELTSEIESTKRSEKFYHEEIEKLDNEIINEMKDISKLRDEIQIYEKEISELTLKKVNIHEIVDELSNKIENLKLELQKVGEEYKNLKDELIKKREELEKLKDEKNCLLRERDKLIEVLRITSIEVENLELEHDKLKEELVELNKEKERYEKSFEEFERGLNAALAERNDIDRRLFSIRSQLADVEDELKNKEVELAKVRASLSTIQSYSKPVELILEAKNKRALPGVFGTVAQLGEVNDEFTVAIEAAAGNALQYIVVETEDDAVRAINYLKMIGGGKATFIPLQRIREFNKLKLDTSLLNEPGVIDYAVNLVECERKFEPVFRFILRDTLVVDKIETARRLMGKGIRIVTLDGDVVERSGLMTGGSVEKKRGMLISKELFEKEKRVSEELVKLQKKKNQLLYELNSIEARRRDLQEVIEKLNSSINEFENNVNIINERINGVHERLAANRRKYDEKRKIVKENTETVKELNSKIGKIERTIAKIEEEINEIERKLKGSKIPKLTEELDKIKEDYTRNKEILFSIEKRIESVDFKRSQLLTLIKDKEDRVSELKARKEELEQKIELGRKIIKERSERLKTLREEEEKIGKAVKNLRQERDELIKKLKDLEDEKNKLNFLISSVEEKIKVRIEKLQAIESEINSLGIVDVPKDIPPLSEVEQKLNEIENELSKFGDVNLKAIQEYEDVKRRRDDLLEKKFILEKERRDILEKIERYERRKKEVFFEVFNAINRNFAEIIRELTEGDGQLYLDSDDPFNSGLHIRVKLNNKPIQKLESMSGGEKSLVALALIFAIQMYKPAPFYAFDEVDMFLDGVNVSKLAKMIKKRAKDAQFIVVSLRKPMIENADAIIGITLGRDNSSTVTGIKLKA